MKTKSILISKKFPNRVWEICEVIHAGTIEQYNRLIGRIDETKWGYCWSLANCESASYFPTKAQALRALKIVHQKHKNGQTGYI
ncbi:hypothetical protein MVUOKPPV_CDS0297 [Klebsiella phage phi1_175008]|uniref:Uncharacterized protein n=2 Tax=Klebsiella phage phi1_175008 TaxID=3127744 RepID=A0AC61ZSP7_9CAUD